MRKTKSAILEAVHATAKGLHKAGAMDQVMLRKFDRQCLPPIKPLEPAQIKRIREASHVSQALFAHSLNTSLSTVQKWEIWQKKPTGTALKLWYLVPKRGLEIVLRSSGTTGLRAQAGEGGYSPHFKPRLEKPPEPRPPAPHWLPRQPVPWKPRQKAPDCNSPLEPRQAQARALVDTQAEG